VRADLTWECTLEEPLDDGDYDFTATETDQAGHESPKSDSVKITVDTVAPSKPVVNPTNGSKVSGTADPDSTVTVYDEDGKPVPGCVDIQPDETGYFECTPEEPLKPGTEITVIAKDAAGNTSDPVVVTVNAISIVIAHPTRMPDQTQVVTGFNFNPGENVCLVIYSDPMKVGCADADAEGKVTFNAIDLSKLAVGTHTATLTGEESGAVSSTFQVVPKPVVKTGGTSLPQAAFPLGIMLLAAMMVLSGVVILPRARRTESVKQFS
jgi:adhesin/invasin